MISAVGAQLDEFLHLSAQCPWRMSPPLQHTKYSNLTGAGIGWGAAALLLCQALFLSKDRWPDAGASYCSSQLGLHSLFGSEGVSTALPAFSFH